MSYLVAPDTRDVRIDYLRVAAIGLVLLHHSDDYGVEFLRTTRLFALADDILTWAALAALFVLSGFLTLKPGASDTPSGWAYFKRRFLRLYPAFAVALVLIKLLGAFPLEWKTVIVNLALMGPWIGPPAGTLWFVEILLYYHALYAIWLSAAHLRMRPWTIPVLLGLITGLAGIIGRTWGFTLDARLVVYLPAFAGGACFGATLRYRGEERSRVRDMAGGAAATVVAGAILGAIPVWAELPLLGLAVSIATTFVVGLLLTLPRRPGFAVSASQRAAHQVAYGSFMAYLIHRIVFRFAANLAAPLGEVWVSVAVVACIPVVLVIGILVQKWYDGLTRREDQRASLPA